MIVTIDLITPMPCYKLRYSKYNCCHAKVNSVERKQKLSPSALKRDKHGNTSVTFKVMKIYGSTVVKGSAIFLVGWVTSNTPASKNRGGVKFQALPESEIEVVCSSIKYGAQMKVCAI